MNTKAELLVHLQKVLADKAKWMECVETGKPLSSLKKEGVRLEKLQ